MEFHENKAKTPFIRLMQLWQAVRRWRRQMQARRVLQQMSDAALRTQHSSWASGLGAEPQSSRPDPAGPGEGFSLLFFPFLFSCLSSRPAHSSPVLTSRFPLLL